MQYFFFFDPKVWCDSNVDHLKEMNVCFLFSFFFFYGGNWLLYNVCERVCVTAIHACESYW